MSASFCPDAEDPRITATADDAILAKLAAVQAGYYDDPFLEPFQRQAHGVSESSSTRGGRRRIVQPIIKRGTHARICCMERSISAFCNVHAGTNNIQVIVLGSGKDTSFFRWSKFHPDDRILWYEVDQASIIKAKSKIVLEASDVFSTKVQSTAHGFSLTRNRFNEDDNQHLTTTCQLVEHDLRTPTSHLVDKLRSSGVDTQAPTLFLFECVLMYLPVQASEEILSCLTHQFAKAHVCCYEPILGSDTFGNVMEQNLIQARVAHDNCCMRQTRTLESHLEKLVRCGFHHAVGCDMSLAYETIVTGEQRSRASRSEFLDEVEEWLLIMRHYCFIVAAATTTSSKGEAARFCAAGPDSPLGFVRGKCIQKCTRE